jgi:tRNA pseudouridine synthase 10
MYWWNFCKFEKINVFREDSNQIKEGEEEKTKCYEALCYTDTQIDQNELDQKLSLVANPLIIEQKTPIRVLHR